MGFVVFRWPENVTDNPSSQPLSSADVVPSARAAKLLPPPPPKRHVNTIFDGSSSQGWMLCNRAPVSRKNIQRDGLNPHGTGSYLVVYEQKLGDFVLDFDYKLTSGCNSGVFLRVSDLNNPVETGIEVALDDTRRDDDRDSGAFYGLVPPTVYAQKPAGQWNHMTITAQGPKLAVSLNGTEVSSINLDLWTVPGKRPDGSVHRFKNREVARMARTGYLGFQDLGGDCWFKNIVLTTNLAMALHRLKQPGDKEALKQAVSMADDPNFNWQMRPTSGVSISKPRPRCGTPGRWRTIGRSLSLVNDDLTSPRSWRTWPGRSPGSSLDGTGRPSGCRARRAR
jgi:hypothetical protein